MADSNGKIEDSLATILKAGAGLSAGLTAPLVAIGATAIKAGQELNRGMTNVQSLDLAQDRVAELRRGVQDVAIATRTSTSKMTAGLYQIVSAFGDSSESIKLLEINARAAVGGLADVSDAVSLSSSVMKGYGDVSAAANRKVVDLAQQTVNLGTTTFPKLAASMGRVAPIAAAMNVSQEELFATMATLTNVTGNTAEVTTQMRGAMQAFMAPSAGMATLIADLGFESSKAMIGQLGFHGAVLNAVSAAEESGKPLQNYIGSIEGQTAALALAGGQAEVYLKKLAAMADAAGAADAVFLAQTEGINASGSSMDGMRVKLEVMMQRLSDGLAPAISAALDVVGPFLDKIGALATRFAELDPKQQKNIVRMLGLVASARSALMILGDLSHSIGGILDVSKKLAPAFGKLGGWIGKMAKKAIMAIPKLFTLAVAHWAVVGPILAIVAGLALLGAGVYLVIKHWDKIKNFFVRLWEGIKNVFSTAVDFVVGLLDSKLVQGALVVVAPFIGIPLAIIKNWDAIKEFFVNLWEGIKGIFSAGIEWVKNALTDIPLVGKALELFGKDNKPKVGVVDTLSAGAQAALPAAEKVGFQIANAIAEYFPRSDAKKGPLSKLTESGGALVDTLSQGAAKRRLNISSSLKLPAGRQDAGGPGQTTVINIDNLTVQSDDAEDIFSFVRMIRLAGGAA